MSTNWPSHVIRAMRPLEEGSVSREVASSCMRSMRIALLAVEVREDEADACILRIFEALPELPADGSVVHAVFEKSLKMVAGLTQMTATEAIPLSKAAKSSSRWDLKELDNRMRPRREEDWTPATPLFRRPMMERMPKNVDLSRSRKFRMTDVFHGVDHVPGMSREKVDRLVRSIGKGSKDFGPEPPTGASPAWV